MDIKALKTKFKKVETLMKIIDQAGEANAVEKDLLILYLKDIITSIKGEEEKVVEAKVVEEKIEQTPKPEEKPEENIKIEEDIEEEKIEIIQDAPPVEPVPVLTEAEPVVQKAVEEIKQNGSHPTVEIADLDKLFESEVATDISEKLSLTKVSNIEKSMGINEKIFTIRELFGGDSDVFSNVMSEIQGMENYDQAISYLKKGVAQEQNWADPTNFKKAKKFLRLVQRRFA